tara:strand:- start:424 stop:591 length:168 start_codon:yes stop_codon:yes gene_type:complete
MSKDNDPRHEIAMAIDRVSEALALLNNSMNTSGDNTDELLAAIAFLEEAQRKVNQ